MGILGMWMWSDNIYQRGAEHVFSHCKDAGVTDIYLLVKGMRGTTAFHSPLTTPSVKERDLLQEALDAAHKLIDAANSTYETTNSNNYFSDV